MTVTSPPLGRRERNKQEKRERIVAAASRLFADNCADDVTTQQIADAADIGTGTLFLYARTKGELILLVQNTHYVQALAAGRDAAAAASGTVDAILALVAHIVACNRVQVDNGRVYLREMLFGDANEPNHAEALRVVAETEQTLGEILTERAGRTADAAAALARAISAAMFVAMAASPSPEITVEDIVASLRTQLEAMIGEDH